jgi:hypothetical protein
MRGHIEGGKMRPEIVGEKVHAALKKFPERYIPLIIGYLLRQYGRNGLAELVEKGWNWKPELEDGL